MNGIFSVGSRAPCQCASKFKGEAEKKGERHMKNLMITVLMSVAFLSAGAFASMGQARLHQFDSGHSVAFETSGSSIVFKTEG